MTRYVEYRANNSGGHWWLTDEDWVALEAAGWVVRWAKDNPDRFGIVKDGRYLDALAIAAYRIGNESISTDRMLREAISEFNDVTSCNASTLGCFSCCGPPHYFSVREGDPTEEYSGTTLASWSPSAPEYGEDYWV